ncbi:MAG: phospholipase D-like domain-containing protein, partial [Candidatus Hodarchaeota archaeon]
VYDSLNLKGAQEKKFIGNLHSKAVITEKELLVGSANFTARSMYYNVENAIYTNDMESVKASKSFFLNLWNKLRVASAI